MTFRDAREEESYRAHLAYLDRTPRYVIDGVTYGLSEEDLQEVAMSARYYPFIAGDFNSSVYSTMVSTARLRLGSALTRAQILALSAAVLRVTPERVEQSLDWTANYMAFHDGGDPAECHPYPPGEGDAKGLVKFSFPYCGNTFTFATAAELRDALLASWPGHEFFNAPVAATPDGRDWSTFPAWGWLDELLRARSDWWLAAGLAVQHAAHNGGDLARTALADFLESYPSSAVLLDSTEPLAQRWPDAEGSYAAITNGRPCRSLAVLVADQRAMPALHSQASTDAKTSPLLDLAPL